MKLNIKKNLLYIAVLAMVVSFAGCFKTTENNQPIANLKAISDVAVGTEVVLDGTASKDPENAKLTYVFRLIGENTGDITDELVDGEKAGTKKITVNKAGKYTAYLTVNDGSLDSKKVNVVFNVTAEPRTPSSIDLTPVVGFEDGETSDVIQKGEELIIRDWTRVEKGAKVVYNLGILVPAAKMDYKDVKYWINNKLVDNTTLEKQNEIIIDTNTFVDDSINIKYQIVDGKGNYYEGTLPEVLIDTNRGRIIPNTSGSSIALDAGNSFDENYSNTGMTYSWGIVAAPKDPAVLDNDGNVTTPELIGKSTLSTNKGKSTIFTINNNAFGIYVVRLSIAKNGKVAWKDFEIKVKKPADLSAAIKEIFIGEEKFKPTYNSDKMWVIEKKAAKGKYVKIDASGVKAENGDTSVIYNWSYGMDSNISSVTGFTSTGYGYRDITLTVRDIEDPAEVYTTTKIHIEQGDNPPVAAAVITGDGVKLVNDTYKILLGEEAPKINLDASASSDFDGDTLSYKWSVSSGNITLDEALAKQSVINGLELPKKEGTYKFNVTVNDGNGGTDTSKDITIQVVDKDNITISGAGVKDGTTLNDKYETTYMSTATPGSITLDVNATADLGLAKLAYDWTQVDTQASSVTVTNTTGSAATVKIEKPGKYSFKVAVSDSTSGSAVVMQEKTVDVTVYPGLELTEIKAGSQTTTNSAIETVIRDTTTGTAVTLKVKGYAATTAKYIWLDSKDTGILDGITSGGAITTTTGSITFNLKKTGDNEIKVLVNDENVESGGGMNSKPLTIKIKGLAPVTEKLEIANSVAVLDYDNGNSSVAIEPKLTATLDPGLATPTYTWKNYLASHEDIADATNIKFVFNPADYGVSLKSTDKIYITGKFNEFGWNPAAQEMTKNTTTGAFEWTLTNVKKSDIEGKQFKFTLNGTWDTSWEPAFTGAANVDYTRNGNGVLTGEKEAADITETNNLVATKLGDYRFLVTGTRGGVNVLSAEGTVTVVSAGKDMETSNHNIDLSKDNAYWPAGYTLTQITGPETAVISGYMISAKSEGYYVFELKDGTGKALDRVHIRLTNTAPVVRAVRKTTSGSAISYTTVSAITGLNEGDSIDLGAIVDNTTNTSGEAIYLNKSNDSNDNTYDVEDAITGGDIIVASAPETSSIKAGDIYNVTSAAITDTNKIFEHANITLDAKGDYSFVIRASDGVLTGTKIVNVTVTTVNANAGTIKTIADTKGYFAKGDTVKVYLDGYKSNAAPTITWTVKDTSGSAVTTSGITINESDQAVSFKAEKSGNYNVEASLKDGTTTVTASGIVVDVTALTAVAKVNDSVGLGNELKLDASGSKGNITEYSWAIKKGTTTTPGALVKTIKTTKEMIDWTPSTAGDYNVTLSVMDGEDTVTASAIDVNVKIVKGIDFVTAPAYKSVQVVGDLQLEDEKAAWTPGDAKNNMIYSGNGVWEKIAEVTKAGSQYKFSVNGTWDLQFGSNGWGGNQDAFAQTFEVGKTYRFRFDTNTGVQTVTEF